jgi:predicted ATPase/serine phosphatase RsbU (regulator of sigma subunit)/tRNA A-37 threonylcarbamoyl transferase component Bud32
MNSFFIDQTGCVLAGGCSLIISDTGNFMIAIAGYQITEKIYESGRSLVYRAQQLKDRRPVILKTLKDEYPLPQEILRYRREYETLCSLKIDGTPRPIGLEKINNRLVLIVEDIGGRDLKTLANTRTFTLKQLLKIATGVTRILGEIHAADLIHADIKTSNIIFNPEIDRLQVIDFGSVRTLTGAGSMADNRSLAGTLSYMSPEQTGRMSRQIDGRTDFYSLGVVFYELFTGRLPFETADALELVHAHIARQPPRPGDVNSEVPDGVSDVIIKLLAKSPEDRYQSAAGLAADLAECLGRLERTGQVRSFPLARRDVSDKFQISGRLVGRRRELETLMAAYDRVSRGGKELMLIAGPAGVGKTALVMEAGKEFARREGLFLQGQFNTPDRSVPFAAFVTAFKGLVRQLLTENRQRLARWRDRILAALGSNGQILLELLPEAVAIIGNQPPAVALEPAAAQRRIKAVMRNFIRIFCRPEHPLVLFLDFLNQADSDSLDLMKSLRTDEQIDFLFLIGALRDDQVEAGHPLHQLRQDLKSSDSPAAQLTLANLSAQHVALITAETLNCQPQTVEPLAHVLTDKTHGNPFFLNEFLNLLYSDNLLYFDDSQRRWQWDIGGIQSRMITDNVVDLLAGKLQRLSPESREVISRAAAIGIVFDLQTLAAAWGKSREQTAAALQAVQAEGLILPLGDACIDQCQHSGMQRLLDAPADLLVNCQFQFSHDGIHQAAYELIPADARVMVHHQIGSRLQESAAPDDNPDRIFMVIDQLNAGRDLLAGDAQRVKLAELNLTAGNRAKTNAIFTAALGYFKTGLDLLGQNCWDDAYDLALGLHTQAAEMSYLCSHDDEMETLIQVVLEHARSPLDQAPAYGVKIQALNARNRWAEAADEALEILGKLGLDLPTTPGKLQVEMSLLKTKFLLTGKSFVDLAQLPPMTDPYKTAIMQIAITANAALITIYPDLYPILANEMIRLTVQHGSGPGSATAYLNYGMLLGSRGDMESGYQFGQLAMGLLEQPGAELSRLPSRFAFNWVMRHWKEHLRKTLAPILEINQSAREMGDPFYIAYSSAYYIVHMFYGGLDLPSIAQAASEHASIVKATGVDAAYHFLQLYRQVVSNLTDSPVDPGRLAGEFYDEDAMLAIDTEADNKGRDFGLYNCKLLLCLLYRQYDRAVKNADRVLQVMEGAASMGSSVPPFYCWDALARLGAYPEAAADERKLILKQGQTSQEKLRVLAQQSPVNYRHKYDLVNAERHRVLGRDSEAMALFDRAIQRARQSEYLFDVALANEMAARFYLDKNRVSIARSYMTEARYGYLSWGAAAKVRDLEENYPELLLDVTASKQAGFLAGLTEVTTTSSEAAESLDLASVLKSTQAMSSEIVLDKLLETLLNLTMENAGAQRGVLVLESEGQLFVEAEMSVDRQDTTVRQSTPLDRSTAISKSIVNYVSRTAEPVVLDNAAGQGKFTNTPYILNAQPKSILCMPLTTKDKLVGVLYLENNLAAGAFTSAHLQVLKVLSSQAAISLENARLYDRLADYSHSLEAIIAALNLAQEVQQNLLPQRLPRLASIDVAGRSLYCDETGGDYFDFLELSENRLGVVVGDVTGHGVAAALLMASVRGFLRARATQSESAAEIIAGVNRLTAVDTAETGQFMTLFYLVLDQHTRRITWVRAGHDPGLLYCPHTDRFEELAGAGLALGIDEDWPFKDFSRTLEPGQIVLLTTDGIFEAHNPAGEMFGKDRFKAVVRENAGLEAEGLRKAVFQAVTEFRGTEPQEDDITLVVLKFL